MGMSLLDRGNETVTVYPEIEYTDTDGNPMTGPATTGYQLSVMIQPLPSSGTSARRSEQDNEGFEIETNRRMRVKRGAAKIGAQARIGWNNEWWSVIGDPTVYNTSPRTAHTDYTIRRN